MEPGGDGNGPKIIVSVYLHDPFMLLPLGLDALLDQAFSPYGPDLGAFSSKSYCIYGCLKRLLWPSP